MLDKDARMWCTKGTEMAVLEIGKSPKASERRRKMSAWLDEHIEGEYTITPWLIGFEHPSDAILFKLGYTK